MSATPECSSCGRSGGFPVGGASINATGYTGACLRWAVQLLQSYLYCTTKHPGAHWNVHPNDVVSFGVIVTGINALGCGYLHWIQTGVRWNTKKEVCESYGTCTLRELHERYTSLLRPDHEHYVSATLPDDMEKFYPYVEPLHQRCEQLITKVYALSVQLAQGEKRRLVLASMSGAVVREVDMPLCGSLADGKLLPQPLYRRAADGNLYTLQDFRAYYGADRCNILWVRAAPCYDHRIVLVDEQGRRVQGRLLHAVVWESRASQRRVILGRLHQLVG